MNCDAIARWYLWLEYLTFGRALARRRREYLEEVADARSVLILGDGDGRFAAEFIDRNREAVIDCVDLSPRMLDLAKRRTPDVKRLHFWRGDARIIELPRKYDVIVSHFFWIVLLRAISNC